MIHKKGSGRSARSAFAASMIEPHTAVVIPKDRRRPEPIMSIPRSVADVIQNHVTLEVESIDGYHLKFTPSEIKTTSMAIPGYKRLKIQETVTA